MLAEARAHFADHCALCHANDGSGKTRINEGLYPPAPDLRDEWTQHLTDGEIFGIIRRLNQEQNVTMLLVEQNANMALEIGDRGYVLEVGRIVMEDTCKRLAENKDVQEFYLGMKAHGVRGQRRWKKKKQWR